MHFDGFADRKLLTAQSANSRPEAMKKLIRELIGERLEDERAEGKEEGREEGIEGQLLKLINLVRKKLYKKMSMGEIADMLEEEGAVIALICDLIQAHTDWDDERICRELTASRNAAVSSAEQ